MPLLKTWTGTLILSVMLSAGAHAEVTISQSNDPTDALDASMTALLGQEHSALGRVSGARLEAIVSPPARKTAKRGKQSVSDATFDEAWIAAQPKASGDDEFQCLAKALYFEARGESIKGQAAVAEVILNRVESSSYPGSICGVVNQSGGGSCQFSFMCDGLAEKVSESGAWDRAAKIARAMLDGAPRELTDGATHFHTNAVRPGWSQRFTQTTRIGAHIFYRQPIVTASN